MRGGALICCAQAHRRHVTQNSAEGEEVLTAVEFVPGSPDVTDEVSHAARERGSADDGLPLFSAQARAKRRDIWAHSTGVPRP